MNKIVTKHFRPGGFGFHELLDRSCLAAEFFSETVASHPSAKHPKLRKKAKKLEAALFDFYQRVSKCHFSE